MALQERGITLKLGSLTPTCINTILASIQIWEQRKLQTEALQSSVERHWRQP
jgi:hypothetical protein